MLQEARIVRTGTERLQRQVAIWIGGHLGEGLGMVLVLGGIEGIGADFRPRSGTDGLAGLRICQVLCDAVHQMLKILAAADRQICLAHCCRY